MRASRNAFCEAALDTLKQIDKIDVIDKARFLKIIMQEANHVTFCQ